MKQWHFIAIGVAEAVLVAAMLFAWYKPPREITRTEYVKVPEIRETVKIKRVEVPVEKIITLEKTVVVEKLKLPEWIAKDAAKQVVSTADFPPTNGGYSAACLVDTTTGEGQIVAKEKRPPFFEFLNEKEIGAMVGLSTARARDIRGYGQWTPGRIGIVHGAMYVEGGSDSSIIGGKIFVRW